jgi:uncharacterized membrane-anchored protein
MIRLPANYPERYALAEEVHARPSEAVSAPLRSTYLGVLVDSEERDGEFAYVGTLCSQHGVTAPQPGTIHFTAQLGQVRMKWERHGEFSSYVFHAAGVPDEPFTETAAQLLPQTWLGGLPGRTIVAAHTELRSAEQDTLKLLQSAFGSNSLAGATISDGAGRAYTDFRIHSDGCTRLMLFDHAFTPNQAGRVLQRLHEIEAYRMLALLALPIARRQAPRVLMIEKSLAQLTDNIARDGGDEALLGELTRLAAEVESGLSASQFRFGATRAYYQLVQERIGELREQRLPGVQTIGEFMNRRLAPAVATCGSVSQRMFGLSERVAQASSLLSTRVDIARERQNLALLASMDRRAKLQLRLQQTVEGLSIAAIVYYVLGIIGYGAKALKSGTGWRVDPELVVGAAVPLVLAAVVLAVLRARRRVEREENAEAAKD